MEYIGGISSSVFRCNSREWNEVPKCNIMQVSQLINAGPVVLLSNVGKGFQL